MPMCGQKWSGQRCAGAVLPHRFLPAGAEPDRSGPGSA